MPYTVEFSSGGERDFRKLSRASQGKMLPSLALLSGNPRPSGGTKKLKGMNAWRIRVGDFRIIYEIHDDEARILIIKIAHRSKIYR